MSVQDHQFVADEPMAFETPARDIASDTGIVLPEVPDRMLQRVFQHMSPSERDLALQERLVPVTWLPHFTLYADAAPSSKWRDGQQPHHVVARISPKRFQDAVRAYLRRDLAEVAALGLRQRAPIFSAHMRFSPGQKQFSILAGVAAVIACVLLPFDAIYAAVSMVLTLLFLSMTWLRLLAITESIFPQRAAPEMDDTKLPVFSVLVPVFREISVLPQLLGALQRLHYPADKLDIKLILEETDTVMQRAVAKISLPAFIEVLVVPAGKPQTKPRALNYALQFARGKLLTIYDAEDIPEPYQLRAAAKAFSALPMEFGCLQAELAFYNPSENWLTRQFAIEYATLFTMLLPTMARYGLPLALGGTSNHFRTEVLRAAGGWDPYNVTEDADLGFRLARLGYRTGVLPSLTYEEANTEVYNWLQQRSRWIKGFLQTWLVHMRNPLALIDDIGWLGFVALQASILGIVVSALLQPIFFITNSIRLYRDWISASGEPPSLNVVAGFSMGFMLLGSMLSLLAGHMALARKGLPAWRGTLLSMPLYWLLGSVAGWMALWQFIWRPFHWNKTRHGLSRFVRAKPQ